MPRHIPRTLPPKEEKELQELLQSQSTQDARIEYIAMMSDVDLDMDETEEAGDEA